MEPKCELKNSLKDKGHVGAGPMGKAQAREDGRHEHGWMVSDGERPSLAQEATLYHKVWGRLETLCRNTGTKYDYLKTQQTPCGL